MKFTHLALLALLLTSCHKNNSVAPTPQVPAVVKTYTDSFTGTYSYYIRIDAENPGYTFDTSIYQPITVFVYHDTTDSLRIYDNLAYTSYSYTSSGFHSGSSFDGIGDVVVKKNVDNVYNIGGLRIVITDLILSYTSSWHNRGGTHVAGNISFHGRKQ